MSTRRAAAHAESRASWARGALALVALLAACGGKADDPADDASPAAPSPSPPGAAPPVSDAPATTGPPAAMLDEATPLPAPLPPRKPEGPMPPPAPELPPTPAPPQAEPAPEPEPDSSISVDGCVAVGGYDRVIFFQRDSALDTCAELVLVTPADETSALDLAGLSLPPRWGVESMSAFRCTPEGALVSGTVPNEYLAASGSVSFDGSQGLPSRASLAVTITRPIEDAAFPPNPLIMGTELRADDLALQGSCLPR